MRLLIAFVLCLVLWQAALAQAGPPGEEPELPDISGWQPTLESLLRPGGMELHMLPAALHQLDAEQLELLRRQESSTAFDYN